MKKSERNLLIITVCVVAFFLLNWGLGSRGKGGSPLVIRQQEALVFPEIPDISGRYCVAYATGRLEFEPLPDDMRDPFGRYQQNWQV